MKIAICAALYESGRPFLAAFKEAVRAAAAGRDVGFVAAVDGLQDATAALADLAGHLDVVTVEVPPGHTPAGVRREMLSAGQASGAEILVFVDMDDLIAPEGVDRHVAALAEADFSYGDMDLIDTAGHPLGRRFFDHAKVPDRVDDVVAVSGRNFLGFSNTAVRTNCIAPVALTVPEHIVAADWWFFTMLLLGGKRGRKTAGSVASYRLHDANTLGAGAPRTVAEAIGQTEAMLRHYQAFAAHPALGSRAADTEQVLAKLRDAPAQELVAHLAATDGEFGAWFEGIGRLAANLNTAPLTSAAAQ
jgi:hypothetical protein